MHRGSTGTVAQTTDGMVERCSGDQQMCWVDRGQSFARMAGQSVTRVAVIRGLDTATGSKRKP